MPTSKSPRNPLMEKRNRALAQAAVSGTFDAFRRALDAGGDPHQDGLLVKVVKEASTLRQRDRWRIVEHLITVCGLDPNQDQAKVLEATAKTDDVEMLKLLVELGANPRLRPSLLNTAIDQAEELGRLKALSFLMNEQGMKDVSSAQRKRLHGVVTRMAHQGSLAQVLNLAGLQALDRESTLLGVPFDAAMARKTLLALSVKPAQLWNEVPVLVEETVDIAQWLIGKGASMDRAKNPDSDTVMAHAAYSGQRCLFDGLVALGGDPRGLNDRPLEQAAEGKRWRMVRCLVQKYGADLGANEAGTIVGAMLNNRIKDAVTRGSSLEDVQAVFEQTKAEAMALGTTLNTYAAFESLATSLYTSLDPMMPKPNPHPEAMAILLMLLPGTMVDGSTLSKVAVRPSSFALESAWMLFITKGSAAGGDALLSMSDGKLPTSLTKSLVQSCALGNSVAGLEWLENHGVDVVSIYDASRSMLTLSTALNAEHELVAMRWLQVAYERRELHQAMKEVALDQQPLEPSARRARL